MKQRGTTRLERTITVGQITEIALATMNEISTPETRVLWALSGSAGVGEHELGCATRLKRRVIQPILVNLVKANRVRRARIGSRWIYVKRGV